jgi:2-polyprenyl-3-methyl-5-hydroxy-6-metoxy-1,4-benzoquinol methylase
MDKMHTIKKVAAEFFNLTLDELEERIKNNVTNINKEWHSRKSNEEFYENTENNVIGLVDFNTPKRMYALTYPMLNCEGMNVLDFGGGIGAIGMCFSDKNTVYYYDPGKVTSKFAKFLSEKVNKPITVLTEEEVKKKKYGMIIITDVLEHLKNPVDTMKMLTNLLNKEGYILTTGLMFAVKDELPMHLPENLKFRTEYNNFMHENFNLVFYHVTRNETIYLWTTK